MSDTPPAIEIRFELNGRDCAVSVPPNRMLVDLVRDEFALTGTKVACDQAVCGACTVLINGVPAAACATFAWQAEGRSVTTIEGLARDGRLDPVQQAFKAKSAFQCGYCTPGMIMLTKGLLDQNPAPDRATIKSWLQANICRCTGYQMIVEAVEDAARLMKEQKP